MSVNRAWALRAENRICALEKAPPTERSYELLELKSRLDALAELAPSMLARVEALEADLAIATDRHNRLCDVAERLQSEIDRLHVQGEVKRGPGRPRKAVNE